jgi:hypothetical protein
MEWLLPLALVVMAALVWRAWQVHARARRRQRTIRDVLDAADALEARLRAARDELEAVAGEHENPVLGAMQDILRQRLWLQENAHRADVAQLDAVRQTLDAARDRLDQQLQRVSQARAGR